MISLILALSMMKPAPAATTAQIQPCVWPNTCRSVEVAQIQPCVWPNTCAATPSAQFEVCVWPRRCS
ncbi:MAG: hypothetical protein SF051_10140 [Elusimicrobiota bacterium]|nr:hypothetical protein [Elusimicrobiota bacterium]